MINKVNQLSGNGIGYGTSQGGVVDSLAAAKFQEALQQAGAFQGTSQMSSGSADLDSIFERASQKYGVSLQLLKAVGKAESGFDPNVVSHCGAQGVMQLMPGTAAALGVKDAFDPEQNIMGGAKYLAQKLEQYDGDVTLALAAYNAGSGNVAKYGGVPPFKETRNYISKVLGYMEGTLTAGTAALGRSSAAGAAFGAASSGISALDGLFKGSELTGLSALLSETDAAQRIDVRDVIQLLVQNVASDNRIGSIPDEDEDSLFFGSGSSLL